MNTLFAIALFLLLIISFLVGFNLPAPSETKSVEYDTHAFDVNSEIPNFSQYKDIQKKKNDFFAFLLPKVRHANDIILNERDALKEIQQALPKLSSSQNKILSELKEKYEVELENNTDAVKELLVRVDIIPASLALAQAANESAWGTSRFAKLGNNLFGQWCYVKGCGVVPKQRAGHENHEVAKFDSVTDSIQSYMRNLNSQIAYKPLRDIRASARKNNESITGLKLAKGLWGYSTRRDEYIHEIQAMIRFNQLQQFNRK